MTIDDKMLMAWYEARQHGRPLMRNRHGKALCARPELEGALLKYEGAHDEVTSAGAIFLREAYTRQVIH